MPDKSEYSRTRRLKFCAKLAKLIAPEGSASTLQAVNDAVFPGLADLPDAAFGPHVPALIATRCTALPDADELRTLLTAALHRTGSAAPTTHGERNHPPVPHWLLRRIMSESGGKPGPMLRDWLDSRDVEDVAA